MLLLWRLPQQQNKWDRTSRDVQHPEAALRAGNLRQRAKICSESEGCQVDVDVDVGRSIGRASVC